MFEPFMEFIKESAPSTDFFCFQEVFNSDSLFKADVIYPDLRSTIYNDLVQALPGFNGHFAQADMTMIDDKPLPEGLAIFSAKNIDITSNGSVIVYEKDDDVRPTERSKILQYVRFVRDGKETTLCNFHGIAFPGNKLDTEARLSQSHRIAEFLSGESGDKILGGDFNLLPKTESISIIESVGMSDLIKDFNIKSTRSDISYEKYKDEPVQQYFADFAFTSKNIEVRDFKVPRMNISDHLPLILQLN
jgi:hypothetical protein